MSDRVEEFRIAVSDGALADLRRRLEDTRWPEKETVNDWSQGVPLADLKGLCDYWIESYDWRSREVLLNAHPHFTSTFDDLDIHFVHARSRVPGAVPLILTHSWPDSFTLFMGVIDRLRDPESYGGDQGDAFHVVIPSLPGHGWSRRPAVSGWGLERIAAVWAALMARLGYDDYVAQGNGWGAGISTCLARIDESHVRGVHLNIAYAGPDPAQQDFSPAEIFAMETVRHYEEAESGYMMLQATRPQTIGYALTDSPAGQCAWILEKFAAWSDSGNDPVKLFGPDVILDNVMTYWLSATGASAARLYWESARATAAAQGVVEVPVGVSLFAKEIMRSTKSWASRDFHDLRYWNELETGGHFSPLEQPDTFVEEIRRFHRQLPDMQTELTEDVP